MTGRMSRRSDYPAAPFERRADHETHSPSTGGVRQSPTLAVTLTALISVAVLLGLHWTGLLAGDGSALVAALVLASLWIWWLICRPPPSSAGASTTPPVRLPRRVRRRRGLPRARGTLAPADPAEYWRQKRARQAQDRRAQQVRARRLEALYAPWPWRRWNAPAPLAELTEMPGQPGHYQILHARDLWIWSDGDWQPLDQRAGGVLAPPDPGAPVRVYGARFDWDERHAPVYWVEIGPDGVVPPAGDGLPDSTC